MFHFHSCRVDENDLWCRYTRSYNNVESLLQIIFDAWNIIIQVLKTFPKNVEGCRDGSAKNHVN